MRDIAAANAGIKPRTAASLPPRVTILDGKPGVELRMFANAKEILPALRSALPGVLVDSVEISSLSGELPCIPACTPLARPRTHPSSSFRTNRKDRTDCMVCFTVTRVHGARVARSAACMAKHNAAHAQRSHAQRPLHACGRRTALLRRRQPHRESQLAAALWQSQARHGRPEPACLLFSLRPRCVIGCANLRGLCSQSVPSQHMAHRSRCVAYNATWGCNNPPPPPCAGEEQMKLLSETTVLVSNIGSRSFRLVFLPDGAQAINVGTLETWGPEGPPENDLPFLESDMCWDFLGYVRVWRYVSSPPCP
jgi:hypothetical protein